MPPKQNSQFTSEDKQQLISIITEMRSRGIQIPNDVLKSTKLTWSVDGDGWFLKRDGKNFIPTERQNAFIASKARFGGFVGGRGSGKTTAGAQKALKKVQQGLSGSVMNPDFENFKYSTWPELKEWIPWNLVAPSQRYRVNQEWEPHEPFTMSFMNGAKMICKGLKDPDSARGPNINWLWYDEAGRDQTGLAWKIAVAGVRVGKDPQAWITTTPKGIDHWIFKFFVKKDISPEVIEAFRVASTYYGGAEIPLVEIFYGSINDNKANLDPAFYAQMLALYPSGWLRDQELDGQFRDPGGAIGHMEWFLGKIRGESLQDAVARVRYWDLAATEKQIKKKSDDPDHTCGTLLAQSKTEYMIEHQVSMQIEWADIRKLIIDTAKTDGPKIPIFIEQEPGAGSKNLIADIAMIPELAGYDVMPHRPDGDKVVRALPWFGKASLGLIYLKQGEWNQPFLDQLSGFPMSAHDDKIDSISGCFATIGKKQWKQIEFIKI